MSALKHDDDEGSVLSVLKSDDHEADGNEWHGGQAMWIKQER